MNVTERAAKRLVFLPNYWADTGFAALTTRRNVFTINMLLKFLSPANLAIALPRFIGT
jgi:hypothetical protein